MGIYVDKNYRYIITELMPKGSLFDIIHAKQKNVEVIFFLQISKSKYLSSLQLKGKRIKQILIHSARGILYLHSMNPPILHRDLKSHNLLVDENWTVKVADFGLSRTKVKSTMTATGTPQWSAPEVIRKESYSEKADVYSYGVIIYELLTGKVPYDNMSQMDVLNSVGNFAIRLTFTEDVVAACPVLVALAQRVCFLFVFANLKLIFDSAGNEIQIKGHHLRIFSIY